MTALSIERHDCQRIPRFAYTAVFHTLSGHVNAVPAGADFDHHHITDTPHGISRPVNQRRPHVHEFCPSLIESRPKIALISLYWPSLPTIWTHSMHLLFSICSTT